MGLKLVTIQKKLWHENKVSSVTEGEGLAESEAPPPLYQQVRRGLNYEPKTTNEMS